MNRLGAASDRSGSPGGPASADDAELIARVLNADDRSAFAQLVRRHQSPIRAVLRRLARGDHGLADDLAQECFLQAYLSLRQFRGDARFRTWLYRIACNLYFQHSRRAQAVIDRGPEISGAAGPADDSADFSVMAAKDLSIDIGRALDTLGDAEREAIVCCYFADLSHGEAAALLGCPLGTLKSHVSRARHKLRQSLEGWDRPDTKEAWTHG